MFPGSPVMKSSPSFEAERRCPFAGKKILPHDEFKRIHEHYPQLSSTGCTRDLCQSGRMVHTDEPRVGEDQPAEVVEEEALDFLMQLRRDGVIESDEALERRISVVVAEIRGVPGSTGDSTARAAGGSWHQTTEELEHGIRLAWKHAKRCIMRSEYTSLRLNDFRHVETSKEMATLLLEGMREAFNGGDIRPSVFMFPPRKPGRPGPMVWNQQLLAFAGYRQADGTVLGDPANVSLTESIMALGWEPPALRTRWDLLPLVTMAEGDAPCITPIPADYFPLVPLRHPDAAHALAFDKLGLRWVPAPALSRLGFDIGGVQYTAAPFIGWFMDAEIGVRDLADQFRYDALPSVAAALGLLKGQELDELPQYERLAVLSRAQAELNRAAFWSFAQAGVRMSDTLTASAMYCQFDDEHLAKHGFRLPADPYWIAPPQGSIVPLWHRGGAPNYQPKPMICRLKESPVKVWNRVKASSKEENVQALAAAGSEKKMPTISRQTPTISEGPMIRIYYCSSGTTAQRLANRLERRLTAILGHANEKQRGIASPKPLNSLELDVVTPEDTVLVIASSAGRGDVPSNGLALLHKCKARSSSDEATGASLAIFGNGNSSYGENFNGAALKLQAALKSSGFEEALPLSQGDTLREDPPWRQFDSWIDSLQGLLGDESVDDGSETCVSDTAESYEETLELQVPPLAAASLISTTSDSDSNSDGMKRVVLDVGKLEYGPMSHVDIFVPLADDETDGLLRAMRLNGKEIVHFAGRQATTRQLVSLIDSDKPFVSLRWAEAAGIEFSVEQESLLSTRPVRDAIKTLPFGWQKKVKHDSLARFIAALPFRRPRTYSTASSQMFQRVQEAENELELLVQRHSGGLFSDWFLGRALKEAPLYLRVRHGPGGQLVNPQAPLIAFATGTGIAPLRALLQARVAIASEMMANRSDEKATSSDTAKAIAANPVTLFIGFKSADASSVSECVQEATSLGLVDMLLLTPSNPARERVQDKVFTESIGKQIRKKIQSEGANVFVCASREAADDFAGNLGALVGVGDIRDALGERWIEEVFVAGQA